MNHITDQTIRNFANLNGITVVSVKGRDGVIFMSHEFRRVNNDWMFPVCFYNKNVSPGIDMPVYVPGKDIKIVD